MEKIVRTACQGCHCECGVYVHVKDGKVVKIKGDPEHPMNKGFICIKGRAYPELVHHPDRILYPKKRVGERGGGEWQRISWDQALDEIAEKLTKNKDKYGPESFMTIHGTGPRPILYSTFLLASALNSPNFASDNAHICYIPSFIAGYFTLGDTLMMEAGPDYINSKCIVVFGGNPLEAHPARGAELLQAKRKGAKLIVVDPRRTELASKADLWLQIRPGTDLALAMGMIRTILDEELYDKEFVDKWCYGFDELKERVAQYPVDKMAEITWLSADQIREAARLYATTKPAVMTHRVAIEHNTNSTQACRTLNILIALTGNIDVAGGNVFPMPVPGGTHGDPFGKGKPPDPEIEAKRIGAQKYPLASGPGALAPFVPPPLVQEALRDGNPYPIKALFCGGGNMVTQMQNSKVLWQSLKNNLDLFVASDFFMTPTVELADYVLPAATWLERDEICDMMYNNYMSVRQKAIEPLGECWHDLKMTIEIVKRIPWANRDILPYDDVADFNRAPLEAAGTSWEEFKEKGLVITPMEYKKYERNGFRTPTGKVELYATAFEKHGHDPLPYYIEPPESPVSTPELLDEYPYILFTGGRHVEYFHSEGRQIKTYRKRVPDPSVELHPQTADKLGIKHGDWIWIETAQIKGERITMKARVTDTMHPSMVHAEHGWWFPEKPAPEHGCFDSNINVVLTDDPPREDICCTVRVRGTLCKIYK
jgi:anaerobic selenocysteine-containing dehydrogenase